jgi:hypothetical protein
MYGDKKFIFHGGLEEKIFIKDQRLNLLKPMTTIVASSVAIRSI